MMRPEKFRTHSPGGGGEGGGKKTRTLSKFRRERAAFSVTEDHAGQSYYYRELKMALKAHSSGKLTLRIVNYFVFS